MLLDSQPIWLGALESVLDRHDIATLAASTTTAAALRAVETLNPTSFVLDPWLEDEGLSGLDLISLLRVQDPDLKIICLGAIDQPAQIDAVFAAGAHAYVLKVAGPDDVAQAIKHVCSESMFFAPSSAPRRLVPKPQDEAPAVELTKRELEILQIVAEGRSNGEIARLLWVTEQTVKFHLSNIYRKLGVSNRTEAGRWAHLHRMVPLQRKRTQSAGARYGPDDGRV